MQKNLNLIFTVIVGLILFCLVYFFFFGHGGKIDQVSATINNIQQTNDSQNADINAELNLQNE